MLEQELASIIKFVLDAAGGPNPYYWDVPADFAYPAVFFPTPELDSGGETFRTYRLEYTWFLQFFHTSTNGAHEMALSAMEAIKKARNLIPLIDTNGEYLREGIKGIRVGEPSLKKIDRGVVQLTIRFVIRRPYTVPDTMRMRTWIAVITDKASGTEIIASSKDEDDAKEGS